MDDVKKVTEAIASGKGFKKYFKGGFGKKAKEVQAQWEQASEKAVAPAILIAKMGGGGVDQSIYAFSTDGKAIPEAKLDKIRERTDQLSENDIKTDDRGYVGLTPLRPAVGSLQNKKGKLTFNVVDLASGIDGVRTFMNTALYFDSSDAAASKITTVLYAKIDGKDYIAPIKTGII